ncbi:MAG: tetratricopeptide repeat protein, partial [Stigonema ocellatum SAG 48.90 = DSM 106950]|nr:tetratricopeptide repeat protein [Stigonema ocellatum SAG 48.90 = DSM 106950]
MKRSAKSVCKFWCCLVYVRRYSVTLLLSMILLSDMVGATPSGKEFRIGQQSVTNQEDAKRAAQEAFQEGFKLYKQGTAESLRFAIAKWEKALELWRQLNDKANLALTLTGIGKVYSDLGEKQKALEYYNLALPLTRAVGYKSLEASTLNNLGLVYNSLGEKQKALEYYNQALPLTRAVGDKSGEARTLNNLGLVYDDLGEKQKALEYYNLALPLTRAVGYKSGEAS